MGERYPDRIPPALAEVLGMPPMELHPWWMALREVGVEVPKRYEGEVASALHFLIPFALSAPDDWRGAAIEELQRLKAGGTFVPAVFQLVPVPTSGARKQELEVEIVDGRLVIAIGVEALVTAAQGADCWDEEQLRVTDTDAFAAEICRGLQREEEDGTTPIHVAIDTAVEYLTENGGDGITFPGEPDWKEQ